SSISSGALILAACLSYQSGEREMEDGGTEGRRDGGKERGRDRTLSPSLFPSISPSLLLSFSPSLLLSVFRSPFPVSQRSKLRSKPVSALISIASSFAPTRMLESV